MTPDRRHAVKHGWFTTWQWAVLGAYAVAIVLAFSVGKLASRADGNARRGNAAICVEVGFLENSLRSTDRLARENPISRATQKAILTADPREPAEKIAARLGVTVEQVVRVQSVARLTELIRQLRAEVPSCTDALR